MLACNRDKVFGEFGRLNEIIAHNKHPTAIKEKAYDEATTKKLYTALRAKFKAECTNALKDDLLESMDYDEDREILKNPFAADRGGGPDVALFESAMRVLCYHSLDFWCNCCRNDAMRGKKNSEL